MRRAILRPKLKPQTFICGFNLVRHIDLSWNTLESSLILMYEKLADLGWVCYNGEIHIVEPATDRSCYHAS